MSEAARTMRVDQRDLEALLASGDVTGALILSPALRETITPREIDLIRQAFDAGLRIGRGESVTVPPTIRAPLDPPDEGLVT